MKLLKVNGQQLSIYLAQLLLCFLSTRSGVFVSIPHSHFMLRPFYYFRQHLSRVFECVWLLFINILNSVCALYMNYVSCAFMVI